MSSLTRLLLNLSIGAKLGIASGLGVLLVATMVIVSGPTQRCAISTRA